MCRHAPSPRPLRAGILVPWPTVPPAVAVGADDHHRRHTPLWLAPSRPVAGPRARLAAHDRPRGGPDRPDHARRACDPAWSRARWIGGFAGRTRGLREVRAPVAMGCN